MENIAPFVLLTLVGIAIIAFQMARASAARRYWEEFAASHDLSLVPGTVFTHPMMSGAWHGVEVRAWTESRGSGKSRRTVTVVEATVPGRLPVGLTLSRQGLGSSLLKLLGTKDLEVGDKAIDGAFLIEGGASGAVGGLLLQPAVRAELLAFIAAFPDGKVEHGKVRVERRGTATDDLGDRIDAVARLAETLAGGGASDAARGRLVATLAARAAAMEIEEPVIEALPEAFAPPPASTASGGDPLPTALSAGLSRLFDGRLSSAQRESLVASLGATTFPLQLVVAESRWTAGLFLPAGLQGGRTVSGTFAGRPVAARFPAERNAEVDAAAAGTTLGGTARLADWDDLAGRPLLDVVG